MARISPWLKWSTPAVPLSARISVTIGRDRFDEVFAQLRPLVPDGGMIAIDGSSVVVEGLTPSTVDRVRYLLRMIAEEADPRPIRLRAGAA